MMRPERRFGVYHLALLGVLLGIVSGIFTIDVFREARPPMSWLEVGKGFAKDLGVILVFEAALGLFLSIFVRSKAAPPICYLAHAVVVFLITLNHQFFLHTGSNLDRGLIVYGVLHFSQLAPVLTSGVDSFFLYRVTSGLLLLLLAGLLATRLRPALRSPSALGLAATALAGIVLAGFVPARQPVIASMAGAFLSYPVAEESPGGVFEAGVPFRPLGPPGNPYNIVLVVLESFRADTVAPNHATDAVTDAPNLLRLAKSGVYVESMYTTISHTSKALVGILCGEFALMRMEIREAQPGELPYRCLPEVLGKQGYRTAFFQTAPERFENRRTLTRNLGFQKTLTAEDIEQGFERVGYFGLDERAMLEPAVRFAKEEGPFFLVLLTSVAHHPYHVPGKPRPSEISYANYRAAVRHVDDFAGQLHQRLASIPQTLFVFVGDHGEAFGEHGGMQHDDVPYEETIRVPAILWGLPPTRIEGVRQHTDLMPTLLRLLEIEWVGELPGKDLLTTGGHARAYTSCWYNNRCATMVEPPLKYIYFFGRRPMQVYNLSDDPEERNDLASTFPGVRLKQAQGNIIRFRLGIDARYESRLSTLSDN